MIDLENVKEILKGTFKYMADSVNQLLSELKLPKDAKILDIGTGSGRMTIILALYGYNVITGEPEDDRSVYANKNWKDNAKALNVEDKIEFQHFTAEELPFDDENFDAIFIFGSFHHVKDKFLTLKECHRVLKVGGLICIIEPGKQYIEMIKKDNPTHPESSDPRHYLEELPFKVRLKGDNHIDAYLLKKK